MQKMFSFTWTVRVSEEVSHQHLHYSKGATALV